MTKKLSLILLQIQKNQPKNNDKIKLKKKNPKKQNKKTPNKQT